MIVIDLVAIMMFLVLLVPSKVMLVINFIALVTMAKGAPRLGFYVLCIVRFFTKPLIFYHKLVLTPLQTNGDALQPPCKSRPKGT